VVAREGVNPTMLRGTTAEEHLNILLGLENHLGKALAPTRSLRWAGRPTKTYYVSPADSYTARTHQERRGGGLLLWLPQR